MTTRHHSLTQALPRLRETLDETLAQDVYRRLANYLPLFQALAIRLAPSRL